MKKKEHFVPQMVLRKFCIDEEPGKCWEYNLYSRMITKKRTKELCAENFLYEIRDDKGNYYYPPGINVVENGFNKLEDMYTSFIDELIKRLEENDTLLFSNDDLESVYIWISLLIVRNPMILHAIPFAAKELGTTVESKLSKSYNFIELMPFLFEKFSADLRKGHIEFLKSSENYSFVISDIPVIVKGNPLHEFCYMPITAKFSLLIQKPETVLTNTHRCVILELNEHETMKYNYLMFDALMNAYESELSFGKSLIAKDQKVLRQMILLGIL